MKYQHAKLAEINQLIVKEIVENLSKKPKNELQESEELESSNFKYLASCVILQQNSKPQSNASVSTDDIQQTIPESSNGMHACVACMWNQETDGSWIYKYETMDICAIVNVFAIAV